MTPDQPAGNGPRHQSASDDRKSRRSCSDRLRVLKPDGLRLLRPGKCRSWATNEGKAPGKEPVQGMYAPSRSDTDANQILAD